MLVAKLKISVNSSLHQETKSFLDFLRQAGKKHSASISVSVHKPGSFRVSSKDPEKLDLFLQELIFNQALSYYLCSVPNRREIARSVVKPVFQQFLEARFRVTYPSVLANHILRGSLDSMIAGDFADPAAQRFEMLFQRRQLRMISGYEFIRDLDDQL